MDILTQLLSTLTALTIALSSLVSPNTQLAQVASSVTSPVFVQEAETAYGKTTSTTRSTSSFGVQAGDVLVAYGFTEDSGIKISGVSGGSLSWTLQNSVDLSGYNHVGIWTAVVDSSKSMSVTFTKNSSQESSFGGNVLVFRGSSGVGASSKTNSSSGAPSLGITTTQDNSAIVVANGDWSANDGSGRSWRSGAGNFIEQTYAGTVGSDYIVYGGYHQDSGSAGSKTVGLSSPSGQKYAIVAVEIKGIVSSGGGGTTPPPPPPPPVVSPSIDSFSVDSSSITSGQSVTLSWSTSNATSISINQGVGSVNGNSSVTLYPSQTTTYTLTASNSSGSTAQAITVNVSAAPQPPQSPSSGSGAPVIFFTDIESGPKTGGENNNGAFVTLYGNNFGSNPTVTVGGGQAIIKMQPTAYLWYQKMVIQLGSNANTGSIVVSNSNGSSNGMPFTVRSGDIYFLSGSGTAPSSGCTGGTLANPWKFDSSHPPLYYTDSTGYGQGCVGAGDILYLMDGVNFGGSDGRGWRASWSLTTTGTSAAQPLAILGYPGASPRIGGSEQYAFRNVNNNNIYMVIGGLRVIADGSSGVGFEDLGHNVKIVGNYVSAPRGDGQSAAIHGFGGNNVRIYGNEVTNVSTSLSGGSNKQYHSMYFSGNNIEVAWNKIHNVRSFNGVQFHNDGSSGFYNLSVHDNQISDQWGHGINFSTINLSGGYAVAYNNIIKNTTFACVYLSDGQSVSTGGTVEVYNNTMYDCADESNMWKGAILKNGYKPNVKINLRNNIIQVNSGVNYLGGDYQNQITGSNNLWYGSGSGPSLTSGNLSSNPQFVSAGSNFKLQASSPAIDKGLSISGLTRDADGLSRPQGSSVDLGAFEYASGGSTTPPPPPPSPAPTISSFSASPSSITSGQSSTLSWSVSGATSLSINQGVGTVSGTSRSVSPTQTTTYTLTATNSSGSNTSQVTVNVSQPIQTSTKFTPGARVQTSSNLNVRSSASAGATLLGTQSLGALGTVVSGGVQADGFFWWNINYDSGVDGWSVEDYLQSYVAPNPNPNLKKAKKIKISSVEGRQSITSYPLITVDIISGNTVLESKTLSADAQGEYAVEFASNIPKNVSLKIKVPNYLSRVIANVDTETTSSVSLLPELKAGDFNQDNRVNSLDFSLMNQKWNQFDSNYDINGDGIVNTLDYSILSRNWNVEGE